MLRNLNLGNKYYEVEGCGGSGRVRDVEGDRERLKGCGDGGV